MKLVRARAKKGRPGLCVEDVSFPENQEGANLPLVLLLPGFTITKTLVGGGGEMGGSKLGKCIPGTSRLVLQGQQASQ